MKLLIMACSATKRSEPGAAVNLYDGPLYRVLRKWWNSDELCVWILSGKHGLIPSSLWIAPYNQRMTADRAKELAPSVREQLCELAQMEFVEMYVEVGQCYRLALPQEADLSLIVEYPILWGHGSIGKRMAALKTWLTESQRYQLSFDKTG